MVSCDLCGFQSNITKMFEQHMVSVHKDFQKTDPENEGAKPEEEKQSQGVKCENQDIESNKPQCQANQLDSVSNATDYNIKLEANPGLKLNLDENKDSHKGVIANLRKKIRCDSCDFVCDYQSSLSKHKTQGCFLWKCAACSFKTSLRLNFIAHEPGKCRMDGNPDNKGHASCDLCDYEANTFGQLKIHKRNKRCYKYSCKYCPFKTSMRQNFTFHQVNKLCLKKTRPEQVKFKITNGDKKGRYSCKFCDYKGNSFANLQFHQTRPCFRHNCQHCEYKTSVLGNLKDHEEKTKHFRNREVLPVTKELGQNESALYVCPNCDYKGQGVQNFNYHKRMKSCYRYTCLVCDFKTSMIHNFGDHKREMGKKHIYRKWNEGMRLAIENFSKRNVRIKKAQIDFLCSGCDYRGKTMPKLEFHKKLGCFRYKCADCEFRSSVKETFLRHKEISKHAKFRLKSKESVKLVCTKCDFKTSIAYNLKIHMKKPNACYRFKCNLSCDFKTSNLSDIRNHRVGHGLGREGKTKGEFPCSKCDHKAKFLYAYLQHKICFRFKCNMCDFKSSYRHKLKAHRLKAGHERGKQIKQIKFECGKCDFKCPDLKTLTKHTTRENQCFRFKCPIPGCAFKSSSRTSLQQHELQCFKEDDNFNCSKCDFKADQKVKEYKKAGLVKHKSLGCFAFKCKNCDFKTSNNKDLLAHKEIHRVTSYDCDKCDYTAKAKTEREHKVLKEKHVAQGCFRCIYIEYAVKML